MRSILIATNIMGRRVRTEDGIEIGVIQNILIRPEDATIVYIILCYADFVGKTHRHFLIPNDMVVLKRDRDHHIYFEIDSRDLSNIV